MIKIAFKQNPLPKIEKANNKLKVLYTVLSQYRSGTTCIEQYRASNLDELGHLIIDELTSTRNEELTDKEKLQIKSDYANNQMLEIEDTLNCWIFFVNVKVEINVIKTSKLIS